MASRRNETPEFQSPRNPSGKQSEYNLIRFGYTIEYSSGLRETSRLDSSLAQTDSSILIILIRFGYIFGYTCWSCRNIAGAMQSTRPPP
ncbi:hypothetical protein PGT21_028198 [Puccinia graminis f. sp. tritici]|uniref:Uncharacterized protein n=1 Tax=Puccinia graminis f. sp. tritici TaxID=56615 RepID=A0A5B0PEJ9_PUCGR|nr:hypothetical protein PGT21_028198 [Puccinia graminis f. sp. tritici]KAA1128118.1 hypothetical protein PGTUg99_011594 [Puccinia graminis f. sp. tritici]